MPPTRLRIPKPVLERFWEKVDKDASPNGCWLWTGGKMKDLGYGWFRFMGDAKLAHRVSMMIFLKRLLPSSEKVLHNCPNGDNPSCVNPSHLWIGTQQENVQDSYDKGRRVAPNRLLSVSDVVQMRKLYKTGKYFQSDLAEMFGIKNASTVSGILLGDQYKEVDVIEPPVEPWEMAGFNRRGLQCQQRD